MKSKTTLIALVLILIALAGGGLMYYNAQALQNNIIKQNLGELAKQYPNFKCNTRTSSIVVSKVTSEVSVSMDSATLSKVTSKVPTCVKNKGKKK